ncbi:HAD family phosphatase [Paenibacillus sp. D2_2]|uniref:HAD family hydrolase n=1 Tax=Paenibacillus sp. D2_2 TaxID=3073092 RepID=UPI002815EA08|nr:HAD family phosphatase [Paenibacillus sp. D2_2]WMT39321.1 HAD family phosphatase [Paenibacillus sp. D2_2]
MSKQAFIFDMDGVIIDSEPLHFAVDIETMEYFGHPLTKEQFEKYVGMTNPEMWADIKREYGIGQTVDELIDYQLTQKIQAIRNMEIEPMDGIRPFIAELKRRGISIGLASSSPRVFIEAVLSRFELLSEFGSIVSGEEVPQGKPAPDVYLEAAKQLRVSPECCVVLEDAKHGVAAAKAAGMKCIGFTNPNSGEQDLSQADLIIDHVGEIRLDGLYR